MRAAFSAILRHLNTYPFTPPPPSLPDDTIEKREDRARALSFISIQFIEEAHAGGMTPPAV